MYGQEILLKRLNGTTVTVFSDSVTEHIYNVEEIEDGTLNHSLVFNVIQSSPYYDDFVPRNDFNITTSVRTSETNKNRILERQFVIVQVIISLDMTKKVYCYANAFYEDFHIQGVTPTDREPFNGGIHGIGDFLGRIMVRYMDYSGRTSAGSFVDITGDANNNSSVHPPIKMIDPNEYIGKSFIEFINKILAENGYKVITIKNQRQITHYFGTKQEFIEKQSSFYMLGLRSHTINSIECIMSYEEELNLKNIYTQVMVFKNPDSDIALNDTQKYVATAYNSALRTKYGRREKIIEAKDADITELSSIATKEAAMLSAEGYKTIKFSLNPELVEFKGSFPDTFRVMDVVDINTDRLSGRFIVTKTKRCYDNPARSEFVLEGV